MRRAQSDCGHGEDNFTICLTTTGGAGLVVAVSLLVVVAVLHSLAGQAGLGLDHVLLPPPPLLAVLQVFLPLVPRPELAHLDLAGGVVVRCLSLAPLLHDLPLSLPQQEGPTGSAGDVATAVRSDLKHLSVIFSRTEQLQV